MLLKLLLMLMEARLLVVLRLVVALLLQMKLFLFTLQVPGGSEGFWLQVSVCQLLFGKEAWIVSWVSLGNVVEATACSAGGWSRRYNAVVGEGCACGRGRAGKAFSRSAVALGGCGREGHH